MATKFDKACPHCAIGTATWCFHPANTEACTVPERAIEHSHLACDSCRREWAEAPPHLRTRDRRAWTSTGQ
jgi:hypothetical protein